MSIQPSWLSEILPWVPSVLSQSDRYSLGLLLTVQIHTAQQPLFLLLQVMLLGLEAIFISELTEFTLLTLEQLS